MRARITHDGEKRVTGFWLQGFGWLFGGERAVESISFWVEVDPSRRLQLGGNRRGDLPNQTYLWGEK